MKLKDLPLPEWQLTDNQVVDKKDLLNTAKILRAKLVSVLANARKTGSEGHSEFLCYYLDDLRDKCCVGFQSYRAMKNVIVISLDFNITLGQGINEIYGIDTFNTTKGYPSRELYLRLLWIKRLIRQLEAEK